MGHPDRTFHNYRDPKATDRRFLCCFVIYTTGPFIILEPHNLDIYLFYVVHERRTADFEALKLQNCEGVGREMWIDVF